MVVVVNDIERVSGWNGRGADHTSSSSRLV